MDIQAARERCEAATEGPWLRHQWGTKSQVVEAKVNTETAPGIKMVGQRILAREMLKANAEFVAHARSDLPAALEALEEAQGKLEVLKVVKTRCQNVGGLSPGALTLAMEILSILSPEHKEGE